MKVTIKEQPLRIDAELLIPGRGHPVERASLVYSGPLIVYVGAQSQIPHQFRDLKAFQVPVLMPGLWDCHVHLIGTEEFLVDSIAQTPSVTAGIRIARDAVATLNAGFTSVREMAGYGVQLAQTIKEGWIPGPNIFSAVSMLSQTAGHGDSRMIPVDRLWDRISHGLPMYLCDGADECTKAVRMQIRNGATLIKVAASGGVTSEGDDISIRQFNDDELQAIARESKRNNLAIAAHCHANAAVKAALRAGFNTIEHGTFLDDEAVELMAKNNVMLVATRSVSEYEVQATHGLDADLHKQMLWVRENHLKSYKKAIAAGVSCALGTDLGASSLKLPWNHGMNGREFKFAVEAGMTPLQAIEAGTANAPHTLGAKAPKSGQLREGYEADFIGLIENPLQDISVLADPNKVIHVWKGGKMYKKDGNPISLLNTTRDGAV